jgi:Mannosyltransferase (PIG-V)
VRLLEPALSPSQPRRAFAPVAAALADRREIVAWWAGSRVLVVGAALAVHWLRAPRGFFGPPVLDHALGALEAWDGVWYRLIAEHGYLLVPGRQSDPAFFPLYPLLLKIAGATGLPLGVAGVVLSNLFFLVALLAFDQLGREVLPSATARRATLLLAVFPTTYVCSMVYPESLVLASFALAGLLALRRRWLACAACAAVAALARPEGVLVVVPIGAAALASWRSLVPAERGRALAAVLAAPAAALSFPLYLGWALHDPLAWSKAQRAWGRSFRPAGPVHAVTNLVREVARQPWATRDAAFCAVTLVLLAVAWRMGAPRAWILLGALLVLLPLGSGSFESLARFTLPALPVYWGLAHLTRPSAARVAVATACATLLVAATATLPLVFP